MAHDLSTISNKAIEARLTQLDRWPMNYADAIDNDPRCGCEADGEGAACVWDDVEALGAELTRREESEIECAFRPTEKD